MIANPKKDLKTGDKIKIKYLPNNPKYSYYIKNWDIVYLIK